MKISFYEVLQVSAKASPEIIEAAYQKLKPGFSEAASIGDHEARNQLLFLEESYAVLSSPEKRATYDISLIQRAPAPVYQQTGAYSYESDAGFMSWWRDSMTVKLMVGVAIFAAAYSLYKFAALRGEQDVLNRQIDVQETGNLGKSRNEAYRVESERMLVQGAVRNQDKLLDRSYDIASQEAAHRKAELESQANARAKSLELQQQRQEAQLQQQRWAQEQYEKERQMRAERERADAPKKQLCNMYALNGNVRDARAAGCY